MCHSYFCNILNLLAFIVGILNSFKTFYVNHQKCVFFMTSVVLDRKKQLVKNKETMKVTSLRWNYLIIISLFNKEVRNTTYIY